MSHLAPYAYWKSRSRDTWFVAKVKAHGDGTVSLSYNKDTDRQSHIPETDERLRCAPSLGDAYEIFSSSEGGWTRCLIRRVKRSEDGWHKYACKYGEGLKKYKEVHMGELRPWEGVEDNSDYSDDAEDEEAEGEVEEDGDDEDDDHHSIIQPGMADAEYYQHILSLAERTTLDLSHTRHNDRDRWLAFDFTAPEWLSVEQALEFDNPDWNRLFFSSFRALIEALKFKEHGKHRNSFMFLQWFIAKDGSEQLVDREGNKPFKWRIVVRQGTAYPGRGKDKDKQNCQNTAAVGAAKYGSKVHEGSEPRWFDVGGSLGHPERILVVPGKNGPLGMQGRDGGPQMHVVNFMSQTEDDIVVKLWRLVGQVAKARLRGNLRRCPGESRSKDRRTRGVEEDNKGGHPWVEINTHGYGVQWLHVRVENKPEYNPSEGYVNHPSKAKKRGH